MDFAQDAVADADGLYTMQSIGGTQRRLYVLDATVIGGRRVRPPPIQDRRTYEGR